MPIRAYLVRSQHLYSRLTLLPFFLISDISSFRLASSLCHDRVTASSLPLINCRFTSLKRAASGSGALPDNEGKTELMSPASLVKVEAACSVIVVT